MGVEVCNTLVVTRSLHKLHHEKGHLEENNILSNLNEGLWITKGRPVVKKSCGELRAFSILANGDQNLANG